MTATGLDQTQEFASPATAVERRSSGMNRVGQVRRVLAAWSARAAEQRARRRTVDAMMMADLGPPLHEVIREMSMSR